MFAKMEVNISRSPYLRDRYDNLIIKTAKESIAIEPIMSGKEEREDRDLKHFLTILGGFLGGLQEHAGGSEAGYSSGWGYHLSVGQLLALSLAANASNSPAKSN